MKITILGCGASAGVPLIGCECAVCTSANPKNTRSRVSILVEQGDTALLIDTSPDLRAQALANGFKKVNAVVYTHAHADHCHGIDDIRSFNYHLGAPIPAYGDAETLEQLKTSFGYVFRDPIPDYGWFRPCMIAHEITPNQSFTVGDITLMPFRQDHGKTHSLGFRINDFVYSTDVKSFPTEAEPHLQNIDTWLLDCLTDERPMPTHAHLDLSLEWIAKFKPKNAVLTHMSHALDYDDVNMRTPANVHAAFDGMILETNAG